MNIKREDYSYSLPSKLIAHSPLTKRDSSRLLTFDRNTNAVEHTTFSCLSTYLKKGDVLVLNDTKVFPARIKVTIKKKKKTSMNNGDVRRFLSMVTGVCRSKISKKRAFHQAYSVNVVKKR